MKAVAPGCQGTAPDLELERTLHDGHLLAHELRRRVAALRALGEAITVLRERGADLSDLVERLGTELDDLEELTREVLGKHRAGQRPGLATADVVVALQQATRTIATARRARIAVAAPPAPLWVRADQAMLRQAIENLLDNAVAYGGPDQASVRLHADHARGEAELLVADRGRGRRGGGYGIGLLLVRRLLEASGGRSLVRQRRGGGTVVSITLPLAPQPQPGTGV